jgi:SAM-dependent methyltransferase
MQNERLTAFKPILCCPRCHVSLLWQEGKATCPTCRSPFPIEAGKVYFVKPYSESSSDAAFQKKQMCGITLTGKLYNLGRKLVSGEYAPVNQLKEFVAKIKPGSRVVDIGSGSSRIREDIFNIDLFAFAQVDALADAASLPFLDNSVDFFILDTILEHVPEPQKIIDEIRRCLKPGGEVICITTFIFPFHGYPTHYFNFTKDGLSFIFKDFSSSKVMVNMGPTSALVNLVSEYFTVAFAGKSHFLYTFCKGLFLIPIFMFKYLDAFWALSEEKSSRLASHFCVTAVK